MSFGLELCLFEEGFSLKLLRWFLKLRFLNRWRWEPEEMMESWGINVSFEDGHIYLTWGSHHKFIHFPWADYRHHRTEVMRPDGSFAKRVQSYEVGEPDGRWTATVPYHYCTEDWEIQERMATICVEEMEWRLRWFPFVRKVRRYIDVQFSEEIGDRVGSWKGGCTGCAYELRKNETPQECLRRMERERKF